MSNPFEPGPFNQPPAPPPYPPPLPPTYPYSQPAQPAYGRPLPPGTVKNYLIESILALFCCAGIFAIPAIIFAAQVDSHLQQGNYQAALDASNNARTWLFVAVGIAIAVTLCCTLPTCVLYIVAGLAGAH
ncbi:MAG TPA: CD225/dispanin family protein [Pirellulaceae bacterium]|nr:CD225/dispanin family protein [Pirellulaceae bacterium]